MKTSYSWNDETGEATCTIFYKGQKFCGIANCAPEDMDMKSEKTGTFIAETRAYINYLKYKRNVEIKNELNGLRQLYYTMKHSSHFCPKSYETRMLMRQIDIREQDLITLKELINIEMSTLTTYIIKKDKFYNTIRKNRKEKI